MKLFVVFGLLLVHTVLAVPVEETADKLVDAEASELVDTKSTLLLAEESDGTALDRQERSYGHAQGHGGKFKSDVSG